MGLRVRGRRFWDAMVEAYEFAPAEVELLAEVARSVDSLEALDRIIRAEGPVVVTEQGSKVHPAQTEARQLRLALGRLLAQLGLPEEEAVASPATIRARNAATTRWTREREKKEVNDG